MFVSGRPAGSLKAVPDPGAPCGGGLPRAGPQGRTGGRDFLRWAIARIALVDRRCRPGLLRPADPRKRRWPRHRPRRSRPVAAARGRACSPGSQRRVSALFNDTPAPPGRQRGGDQGTHRGRPRRQPAHAAGACHRRPDAATLCTRSSSSGGQPTSSRRLHRRLRCGEPRAGGAPPGSCRPATLKNNAMTPIATATAATPQLTRRRCLGGRGRRAVRRLPAHTGHEHHEVAPACAAAPPTTRCRPRPCWCATTANACRWPAN